MERKQSTTKKSASEESVNKRKIMDELLDEALEDTFPASDAVSISQPVHQNDNRH